MPIVDILLSLIIILVSAKVLGDLAERVAQPGVLGELIAGVIIGESVLGLIHHEPTLEFLAEVGVILLLFEIGLETEIKEFIKAEVFWDYRKVHNFLEARHDEFIFLFFTATS